MKKTIMLLILFLFTFLLVYKPFTVSAVDDDYQVAKVVSIPSNEVIEKMIGEIEEQIRKKGKKEITSSSIGEIVMKKIKRVDNVAYIRFASVYRDFQDVSDFKKELKEL